MKNIFGQLIILLSLCFLFSIVGCGSAEAIKGYRYSTPKSNLEKAVMKVIESNPNIYRDNSMDGKINMDSLMTKAMKEKSSVDSTIYYNDGVNYVTIKIKKGQNENDYVLRYYGDNLYWKSSNTSEIFISMARDKEGNVLNQGENAHGEFKSKAALDLINLFEREFIDKLDKELNLKHSSE